MFWTTLALDAEVMDAINLVTPEFASSLKRRFTNVGVSELIRSRKPAKPAIFLGDFFLQENGNQVTLRNLVIDKFPVARMNEITPNLVEKHLKLSADWYNIAIHGSYEMCNTSQTNLIPVQNIGNIQIIIENVTATGFIGFTVYKDALKTTNFDLDFTGNNVTVQVEYLDGNTKELTSSNYTKKRIDETIMKYIKRDLFWKLQQTLQERLDQVLLDFSLIEIFNENLEIVSKYTVRENVMDDFINKIVDKLILNLREYIIQNGYMEINAPDFKTEFSKKFGLITFWGYFGAQAGFVRNLASILRTGTFSFASDKETSLITIFGCLGLGELAVRYDRYNAQIWNIGPSGNIKAFVGDNSINFKIIGKITKAMNFEVKAFDVEIAQLENIKVEATGLGFALDWLLSYIATWTTGRFKKEIVEEIEENLKDAIQKLFSNKIPYNEFIS